MKDPSVLTLQCLLLATKKSAGSYLSGLIMPGLTGIIIGRGGRIICGGPGIICMGPPIGGLMPAQRQRGMTQRSQTYTHRHTQLVPWTC